MKVKTLLILMICFLVIGCVDNIQNKQQNQIDNFPNEEISKQEIEALNLAINDEYKARATYKKVIDNFGEVKPFSNIIKSENNHINQLIALYEKYGLNVPKDDWDNKVTDFDSVLLACQAGVNAEIENAALYDELFSKVDNQDIIVVFTSLRDASENNHLPAFQKCGGLS